MTRFVCLLRGINVSGHRKVSMAELRTVMRGLGFENVATYLQSGNIVFSASGRPTQLAAQIKTALVSTFGHDVETFVFCHAEFRKLAGSNPLLKKPGIDPAFLHVTFVENAKAPDIAKDTLPLSDGEQAKRHRGHFFLYCPNGYGRTRINNSWFERKLHCPATTRNWKTVTALDALLASA